MHRRAFLAWTTTGAVGAFAGCGGWLVSSDRTPTTTSRTESSTEHGAGESPGEITAVAGVDLPVPKRELTRGAAKNEIAAITEPTFAADWSDLTITVTGRFGQKRTIEPRLREDDNVIGLTRNGAARAYPLRILNWHEIANDRFGRPLVVTYCPLCGSAVTAKRTVNGQTTIFGVSGYLWNSDLVMYDARTGSLWSQVAATAIRGPKTGERLSLIPSTLTTWHTWRRTHPETKVLLPPPKSKTVRGRVAPDYTMNPYSLYQRRKATGVNENTVPENDAGLHPKIQVLGISSGEVAKAYPLPAVREAGVINDRVGRLPVVVAIASDDTTLVGYVRRLNDRTLRFQQASDTHMRADGSRWAIACGRAVDGPHQGTRLASATKKSQMFWFAWLDFHPETEVVTAT